MAKFSLAQAVELKDRFRRQAGSFVVDGFFRGISSAGKLHPNARPERHQVEVIRDVAYAPTGLVEHRLDIYRHTAKPGPHPVVIYVHGGGFRILSKDSHWLMGLIFARRGYLVFNISYRLAPKHPYPTAIEDTCTAFEWIVENAAKYGGDLSRLVLAGESAGANLVTSLAIALSYKRREKFAERAFARGVTPRAVVPACGIFQVTDIGRFANGEKRMSRFLLDRLGEVSSAYLEGCDGFCDEDLELADPLRVFEQGRAPDRELPAFFIPVGTRDPLLDDTRRLHTALKRMGAKTETAEYDGEHHAFHAFIFKRAALQCWQDTFSFLERHGVNTH